MTIKCDRKTTPIDTGREAFDIRDKKSRVVGYQWEIRAGTYTPLSDQEARWGYYSREEGDPMTFIEVWGSPTRDGKRYGPAFNRVVVASIEDAQAVVAKRIRNARKTNAKRFAKVPA
jgi:hypothetical protein